MVVSRGNAEQVSRQGARFFLYDVRCGLFLSAQRLINQLYLCVLELVFYINQAHSTKTFTLRLGEKPALRNTTFSCLNWFFNTNQTHTTKTFTLLPIAIGMARNLSSNQLRALQPNLSQINYPFKSTPLLRVQPSLNNKNHTSKPPQTYPHTLFLLFKSLCPFVVMPIFKVIILRSLK
jgi:hypothetical protein